MVQNLLILDVTTLTTIVPVPISTNANLSRVVFAHLVKWASFIHSEKGLFQSL